jgi:flagellar protein FlaG
VVRPVVVTGNTPAREPAPQEAVRETRPRATTQKSASELKDEVKKVADMIQTVRRDLSFSVDADTGYTVVKVVDATNQEVIRQIPSEEFMAMAKRLSELSAERTPSGDDIKGFLLATKA